MNGKLGPEQDLENAEIAQISFFLAKKGETFETVFDPKVKVSSKEAYTLTEFEAEGAKCRFIYFETFTPKHNPPWLDFVNEKLSPDSKKAFASTSASANGILLIQVDGALLAATFGRSASSCLNNRKFEPDFGIKTAMNMCGNEEIRQTKSQSNAITPTQIDRQVAKPSDSFTFGLSEAEDLRYISAHMKANKSVTLQGRDSLTVKIIGKEKLTWPQLVQKCRTFLKEYVSTAYTKLFPNYKNFRRATEDDTKVLDAELLKALQAGDFSKVSLGIPEFLSEEEYSYSYTNNPTKDNIIYPFLDPAQLADCFKLGSLTLSQLHNRRIWAYDPVEDKIVQHKRWYLYDCLHFEHTLGEKYFILSDGRWLEVDDEFHSSIMKFATTVLRVEPCEDAYKDIDISNHAKSRNEERIFNERVCEIRKSAVKFDRAKLKIGPSKSDKEFCDILDMQDDGLVRIINCKPLKDASSINYLFSQAKFYCESFLRDEVFLADIRKHIAASASTWKDKYLQHIAENAEDVHGKDYVVCLWLLYDRKEPEPTSDGIPLIALYELKLMHDYLRKVYKFKDVVLRFIPVKITNYKTAKTPDKKAA